MPFERVRGVITTVKKPRSVEWVADEAAVEVGEARELIGKLQHAGIIRSVGDGDEDEFEPVPKTQLEVTKRAVRDSFDECELRKVRDELAIEVVAEERPGTAAVYRLMAVEECISDIEDGP